MADTIRTLTALQLLLADNITGLIGAQDDRDFLVSCYNWVNKTSPGDIYYQAGDVGIGDFSAKLVTRPLYIYESDTRTTDMLTIEQGSTGDAFMRFLLTGVKTWAIGIDNSDGGAFKIAVNPRLDVDTRLTITSAGVASFYDDLIVGGNRIRLATVSDALANNAAGTIGDMAIGTDGGKTYHYIWFATNTPSRAEHVTW